MFSRMPGLREGEGPGPGVVAPRGGVAKAEAACSEVALAADTAARQGNTAIESSVLFCTIFI